MLKKCLLVVPLLAVAFFFCYPAMSDGQLLKRRAGESPQTFPHVTGRCVECRPEDQAVPQPSLQPCQTEGQCLPLQATVLEPLSGTGSKSPTGLLNPKVEHKIDPETLKQLQALMGTKLQTAPVSISPQLDPETSQRMSRISLIMELLLWLGSVTLGGSMVGRVLPLVAPVVSGLLSALQAASQKPPTTPGAPSSTPPNG